MLHLFVQGNKYCDGNIYYFLAWRTNL